MPAKVIDFSLTETGFEANGTEGALRAAFNQGDIVHGTASAVRVSSFDQNPERQRPDKGEQGVHRQGIGQTPSAPAEALLSFVREGDTVVVHSMDRLARNHR